MHYLPAERSLAANVLVPKGEGGYKEMLPHSHSFNIYTSVGLNLPQVEAVIDSSSAAVFVGEESPSAAAAAIISAVKSDH
jgi:hypothetical protein